ncbi:hypothetical protein SSX86_016423 [Deinandra increscens subsp. villosa]|uniref:Transposase n=1 Tax=Deinandra increscens subsp. villosa TaxID=3103831 RepID=A0AAP0H012_9ASTR
MLSIYLVTSLKNNKKGKERDYMLRIQLKRRRELRTKKVLQKKDPKCVYWKYYDKIVDENGLKGAKCKHYPKTLAADTSTNGTSGLKRHARICPGNPDFKMKDQTTIHLEKKDDVEGGACEIKTLKFCVDYTRKPIAKMIIVDELPFFVVEHEGFRSLMNTVCPYFKAPSRHTIARDCGEIYLEQKAFHKGDDIGRLIQKCLSDWDINHVLTITTDNASSNDSAMSFLKGTLHNLILEGRYLHVRCIAHVINLIVKDGLSSRNKSIERIRNTIRAEKFEAAFKSYDLGDPNFRKELENEIPSPGDWHNAREISKVLEFFKKKTTYASASSYVNVNGYFREMMAIEKKIKVLKGSPIYKIMGNMMEDKFQKYWGHDKFENKLLYFATILDPRQKSRMIGVVYKEILMAEKKAEEKENDIDAKVEKIVGQIKTALEFVFREYELDYEMASTSSLSQFDTNTQVLSDGEDEFVTKFKAVGRSSTYKPKSELQKYLDDDEEEWDNNFDVLKWWKSSSSRYPIVSKMAKDILAIPVSSVASEPAFSTGGRVVDAYRSSLSPPIVEALICTQDWIRKSRRATNEGVDPTKFDDLGNGKN